MFTPKNIQGALEELYDLCDPDYMVDMLVNYSEEFDDISPALLAKSFQKNAEMISEYRVLSSAGEGISRICRKRGVKKMTWWITDTSIGQRLKFVRRFRRLTQKELGLLMGYSEKTADVRIAQYEKNARTPNAETTAKLAEVLKVSPVVFSPTICASREDLLQSMYWLFLMKGGGDIYDCETEYARSRMEQKLGVITVEEFLEKILVN